MSFIFKIEQLEPAIQEFARRGGDTRTIESDVRQVHRLIDRQDYEEAARLVDEILDRIKPAARKRSGDTSRRAV